jgi:hypothetical protein
MSAEQQTQVQSTKPNYGATNATMEQQTQAGVSAEQQT